MGGWVVVDRIENGIAACEFENREMRMLPLEVLPAGVSAGDCLREKNGRYIADPAETQRRREENIALLRSLTKQTAVKPETPDIGDGGSQNDAKDGLSDGFSLK